MLEKMKGVVKSVNRSEWNEFVSNTRHTPDEHCVRHTNTFATLNDGTEVDFDEKDILQSFNRTRFSEKLIKDLESKLVGKTINYIGVDGDYKLDGSISNYI